jgi:hypothetical protein
MYDDEFKNIESLKIQLGKYFLHCNDCNIRKPVEYSKTITRCIQLSSWAQSTLQKQ